MARAKSNKLYRNFTKGLVTEAGPLTYPENACGAMDNCQVYRQGNQSRRLGFDYEDGALQSNYGIDFSEVADTATRVYRWDSVNGDASVSFVVHRIGTSLYFYDAFVVPLSAGRKDFNIDLNLFQAANTENLKSKEVSMVGGKGFLFVVGETLEPFLVEYDPDTDSLTTKRIYIQIRDFKGIDDALANEQEPATLSPAHKYNLMNQGWVDPSNNNTGPLVSYFDTYGNLGQYNGPTTQVITDYYTQFSRYPANNKQWWVARDTATGDFDAGLLGKFFSGNNKVARGHFVVDAFSIDRSAMSGIAALPVESILDRPPTVSFFAGRVWYACNSTVYFSQVLDDKNKSGFCYQEADPTSEDISDLVATDGGVIPIPEMAKAVRLVPAGSGILCFSTNGIWYISGGQNGFTAMDLTVSKVNPLGTESPDSIIEAEGQIFWWSRVGIMGMSQKTGMFGSIDGSFDRTNISETTVQTFYNDIPEVSKKYAKGAYDPATNTILWVFRQGETPGRHMYDRVLSMDLTLGAFYPWTLSSAGPYISDVFLTETVNPLPERVEIRESFVKFICASPTDTRYTYTFGYFKDDMFRDWHGYNDDGYSYLSYLETGYELLEDAMRDKQAPYVWTYFRRTEKNFVAQPGGDYEADFPSSCFFQIRWDWSSSNRSNKWSTKIQAYRMTRIPMFEESDTTFDTGFPIVVTKNKMRGNGKAVQFRFESDAIGKDFDLLGWAVPYSGNTDP